MKNASEVTSHAVLSRYEGVNKDKNNMVMSTIVANFQVKFGLKTKGIDIINNIIKNISEDTLCNVERNILLWNICILIDEYTELREYEYVKELIDKAKRNYSRDVILGDTLESFHISWLDQILLKEAKLYILKGDKVKGEDICREVIENRKGIMESALAIGESINLDRCNSLSYRYLSKIYKEDDYKCAREYMKKALYYKTYNKDIYNLYNSKSEEILDLKGIKSSYSFLVKCYFEEKNPSYDNIEYSYCISCIYNNSKICSKRNIKITDKKSCSLYEAFKYIL
ncbi:hypothetical protein [Clostridium cylindrosporum]|uniref:Uncharacterized protein n=1 Tax=Clostridium cylindrosporum DSM 605 TaxID=1121307 RepID=A0A0J8DEU8_CLOCY|nr:hypothetical protein [Clostridium cylindrosporum]KMT22764.1 hypothetical protein CLCY_11c00980 [Clostridium cylindrosporum DSM 605]